MGNIVLSMMESWFWFYSISKYNLLQQRDIFLCLCNQYISRSECKYVQCDQGEYRLLLYFTILHSMGYFINKKETSFLFYILFYYFIWQSIPLYKDTVVSSGRWHNTVVGTDADAGSWNVESSPWFENLKREKQKGQS